MIKILGVNDVCGMENIEKICFERDAWNRRMIESMVANPLSRIFGFYIEGLLAGYCAYCALESEGHIYNIAVLPEQRRKGFGMLMLNHMLAEGVREGVESFTLEVRVENLSAISLYERAGFTRTGIRPSYYGVGRDALIMWKRNSPVINKPA